MRRRLPSSLLLGLAACLAAGAAGQARRAPERFEERVLVREVAVVVESPSLLDGRAAADFLVLEDGLLRPVARVERLDEEGTPWDVLVYVDEALAPPETVFRSALALATHAADLTALGPVEIVVADPSPRAAHPATREPKRAEQLLADLAGAARIERDKAAGSFGLPRPADAATVRRQCDRLVTLLVDRPATGPKVLLLVAEGFAVTPEDLSFLAGDAPPDAAPDPGGIAATVRETARVLAAYGWLTVVVPLRQLETPPPRLRQSEFERWREGVWGERPAFIPWYTWPRKKRNPADLDERLLEVSVRPEIAPLRALADETAGAVVGYEPQLGPALAGLAGRLQIWYESPGAAAGRPLPLEVRTARTGSRLQAPRWVRSATPAAVAEARLRRLLDGMRQPSGMRVAVSVVAEPAGRELQIEVEMEAGNPRAAGDPGPLRVSLAFATENGPAEIRHEVLTAAGWKEGRRFRHTAPLQPPPGAHRLAVAAEDLARGVWGGVVVELP